MIPHLSTFLTLAKRRCRRPSGGPLLRGTSSWRLYVTNLDPEKNDLIDVIVVDDRPAEQEEIRQLLKEECRCKAIFFADYRNAYKAVLEQAGHRLLVNF